MNDNLFNPPNAQITPEPASRRRQKGKVSRDAIKGLEKTRPWVIFIAILAFIGVAMCATLGILLLGIGGVLCIQRKTLDGIGTMAGGAVYALVSLIYLFPGLYLYRSASAMKDIKTKGAEALERAIDNMRKFWRFTGVITLVSFCLGALFFLAVTLVPFFTRH